MSQLIGRAVRTAALNREEKEGGDGSERAQEEASNRQRWTTRHKQRAAHNIGGGHVVRGADYIAPRHDHGVRGIHVMAIRINAGGDAGIDGVVVVPAPVRVAPAAPALVPPRRRRGRGYSQEGRRPLASSKAQRESKGYPA